MGAVLAHLVAAFVSVIYPDRMPAATRCTLTRTMADMDATLAHMNAV